MSELAVHETNAHDDVDHAQLRNTMRERGMPNCFPGSTSVALQAILDVDDHNMPVPMVARTKAGFETSQRSAYDKLIASCTLEQLGSGLPNDIWQHYLQTGWCAVDLAFAPIERRFLDACYRCHLAELGVDPLDASTYHNADNVSGYDAGYGWLRNPGVTPNSYYMGTHPRVYRMHVGFLARTMRVMGYEDNAERRKMCVELRLQAYNTKLALPGGRERGFSHTDCDWRRPGTEVPAPQAVAFVSPSVDAAGKKLFSFRFFNLDPPEQRARIDTSDTRPYVFPQNGDQHSNATDTPHWVNFARGSALPPIKGGEMVMFTQMTAHEVIQHKHDLSREQRDGEEPVSQDWTRTAEYPYYVSPRLHGTPHQSPSEYIEAMATGKPPGRWAHIYTGNMQDSTASSHLSPLFTPVPLSTHTLLARCLIGTAEWELYPQAVEWLINAASSGRGLAAIEEAEATQVSLHQQMIQPTMSVLHARLTSHAQMTDFEACILRTKFTQGLTTRSIFATDPVLVVPPAAQAALDDPSLWSPTLAETEEQRRHEALVMAALPEVEQLQLEVTEQLFGHDQTEHGLGDDGSMGQCFYCQDGGELFVCSNCPSAFHAQCLSVRKLPVPLADDESSWLCSKCSLHHDERRMEQHESEGAAVVQPEPSPPPESLLLDHQPPLSETEEPPPPPKKKKKLTPSQVTAQQPLRAKWKATLARRMRLGEWPTMAELGTVPKAITEWHVAKGRGRVLLAATPTFLEHLQVDDAGKITAPKQINYLMRLVAADDPEEDLAPRFARVGPTGSRLAWYSMSSANEETLKRIASGVADFDSAIAVAQATARTDRLTARVLRDAGFDRCYTCNMPVLNPDDPEFEAKVEEIERIARGLAPCTDRCCRKRLRLTTGTAV